MGRGIKPGHQRVGQLMLFNGVITSSSIYSFVYCVIHQKSLIGYPFVQEETSPISRLILYATLGAFL